MTDLVDCSEGKVGEFLDLKLKIKSKDSPAEISDDDRKAAAKRPICKDEDSDDDGPDDPNDDDDDDDDCPNIYDIGGDSEMLLNKGVSLLVITSCPTLHQAVR